MKWLETRNEDSKDRPINKRNGWKLQGAKIYPTTEKKLFKNVNYTKFFAKPMHLKKK